MTRASRLAPLVLVLAGCATSPDPAPISPADAARPWVAAEQVSWLRGRAQALGDAPACLVTLAAEAPDLAHALATTETDPVLRARMGAALDRLEGTSHHARSEALRASDPRAASAWAALARGEPQAALDAAGALADPLLLAEAHLAARARSLDDMTGARASAADEPAAATLAQRTRAAYLEVREALRAGVDPGAAFARAAALAREARDGTALERLETLRPLVSTGADPAWHLALAELAARRGAPLVALHHALTASRGGDPRLAVRARVVAARAHLAGGSREVALDEALGAAESARALSDPTLLALAMGAVGDASLADAEAETAAEAYAQALRATEGAGDPGAAWRMRLNLATAHLKRGDAAAARQTLAREVAAPDDPDLTARAEILRTLVDLTAGACTRPTAADRVAAALARARLQGAVSAVESYAGLVERLRGGAP